MAKFTLEFSDEATAVVRDLATKHGTTQSEIVRKAINLLKYLDVQKSEGNVILIQRKEDMKQDGPRELALL